MRSPHRFEMGSNKCFILLWFGNDEKREWESLRSCQENWSSNREYFSISVFPNLFGVSEVLIKNLYIIWLRVQVGTRNAAACSEYSSKLHITLFQLLLPHSLTHCHLDLPTIDGSKPFYLCQTVFICLSLEVFRQQKHDFVWGSHVFEVRYV